MINILRLIPYGENNRISQEELMTKTKFNKQRLTEEMQKIRKEHIILSDKEKGRILET